MTRYEARYTIKAHVYEYLQLVLDSEDHHATRLFNAKSDKEARAEAEKQKIYVGRNYIAPTVTIDSLVRVSQERKTQDAKNK